MKYPSLFLSIVLFFFFSFGIKSTAFGQAKNDTIQTAEQTVSFFDKSPSRSKVRIGALTGTGVALYSASVVGLSQAWYSNYEKSAFHFYDDNTEWLQIDKAGHAWTAYMETAYATDLYRWAGVSERKALIAGAVWAWSAQATIEVLDGFSEKWGASPGDLLANTVGVGMYVAQEIAWKQQIFQLKFSSRIVDYSDYSTTFQTRAADLYGSSLPQKILKDYNGQTYWLSFNPFLFSKNPNVRFPDWLQFSLGYGIENVFGGYQNEWTLADGSTFDGDFKERSRQLYVSMDIDLTRVNVKKPWARTLLKALNVIKFPLPGFVLDSDQNWNFLLIAW